MNISLQKLSVSHRKTNDINARRYERFLKKNKLDNAIMVDQSGDVVDLYSIEIMNTHLGGRDIGIMASIWMQACCKLSNGFRCIGRLMFKVGYMGFPFSGKMAIVWMRLFSNLANASHFIERLLRDFLNDEPLR